jgi:hypothetical protein
MRTADRAALQICAEMGDLIVLWSPYVAAEVARVATPSARGLRLGPAWLCLHANRRGRRDRDRAPHDRCGRPRPGGVLGDSRAQGDGGGFVARAGCRPRPHRRADPRRCNSRPSELPSVHRWGGLPARRGHQSVAFWHADTFLTTFFQREPAVYTRVRLLVGDAIRIGALLPHRER